jgi:exosome complex component CSL4
MVDPCPLLSRVLIRYLPLTPRSRFAHAPRADKQVIGTISRLAPTQAHLSIQISNSRPVPESSEEFTGVIRLADIRLTERDKIKMGDCFRLGDLVKARVVR